MEDFLFAFNSVEDLQARWGTDLPVWLFAIPTLFTIGTISPWPVLLIWFYLPMCPVFAFIYLVLPDSVTDVPN